MSDTDTIAENDSPTAEEPPRAPKSRSLVLPALILAVGLVAGGFLMGSGGSDAPAEEGAGAEEEHEVVPGEVVPLDPMTLNLADGHYLRLGVAVELVEGVPGAEWVEHGESSKYVDAVIEKVGGWSSEQLTAEGGRDELKGALRAAGTELFEHEFHEVYLTEFIVQ